MELKHLAIGLLGWLLLLPPWVAPYKVNMNAPYSQWKSGANNRNGTACVFPSFQACADYKNAQMQALKSGQVKLTAPGFTSATLADWNYRRYWNGRCIKQ